MNDKWKNWSQQPTSIQTQILMQTSVQITIMKTKILTSLISFSLWSTEENKAQHYLHYIMVQTVKQNITQLTI